MAATLEPGVRKFVSNLDLDIVSTIWGGHLNLPISPPGSSNPASPTTIIDHAVASIASGAPAPSGNPVNTGRSTAKAPAKGKKPAHQKPHAAKTQTKHPKLGGTHKILEPRVVIKPHAKTSAAKSKLVPNGSLAVGLSSRGAIVAKSHHH